MMLDAKWLLLAAGVCALIGASCALGPNYKRPPQQMPTTFKSATTQEIGEVRLQRDWWRLFGDPTLDELEEQMVAANPSVQAAMANVAAERAAAGIAKSQFYPTVTLDPSIERGQFPVRTISGIGSISGSTNKSETTTTVEIPFDLNYEIDIWGRVRRNYEAALANYQASADDFEVVLQTAEADLAQDYFNLRSLDDQEEILRRTIESYRTQVTLTSKELQAGLVGQIDYVQAEQQLDSTITEELEINRQRADQEHVIAVLLGRPPSELSIRLNPLDLTPPRIPAGLPSALLRRRPDVAEAEQNLIATNAQIGVAQANFFPAVSLSGLAGFESFDVQHALDWENRIWSLGANASLPIFEGGQLTSQLEQAKALYLAQRATYRGTVVQAISDVETSLTDLHWQADESQAQHRAVLESRDYVRLSILEYQQGLISYLQVIDAERTLLTSELSAAQLLNSRMASTVLLIKALGGGWDAQAAATQPTTSPVTQPSSSAPTSSAPTSSAPSSTQPISTQPTTTQPAATQGGS
jgi:multidrug efflux system outer membrane protein